MKLFVIVRDTKGNFFGGVITGTLKTYSGVKCRELVPDSLVFQQYRRIKNKNEMTNINKFITVKEFREKCNGEVPVKFSQIILDVLGFDRIWIFEDSRL
jgi:hypothetical protein